jgi:hypothetical protein
MANGRPSRCSGVQAAADLLVHSSDHVWQKKLLPQLL